METIFINTENSKTNEPDRFRLPLADKLNLKHPNRNMVKVNLIIYYSWKNYFECIIKKRKTSR